MSTAAPRAASIAIPRDSVKVARSVTSAVASVAMKSLTRNAN